MNATIHPCQLDVYISNCLPTCLPTLSGDVSVSAAIINAALKEAFVDVRCPVEPGGFMY